MRRDLKKFLRDQRGASMPEYALLLFAVLISAAAAAKRVGPRVYIAGDVTRRLLAGEDVEVAGSSGNAFGGMMMPPSGSAPSGDSSGSNGAASGGGGGLASSAAGNGSAGGFGGSSSGGGGASGGGSLGSSGSSSGGGSGSGVLNGGGVVLGATGSQPASGNSGSDLGTASNAGSNGGGIGLGPQSTDALGAGSSNAASQTANSFFGSSAPASNANAASSNSMPQGFLGGTGAPNSNASTSSSGSSGSSASAQNSVNPPPPSSSTDPGVTGDGYAISAAGEKEMQTLLAQAKKNADGKRPLGYCYRQVKEDIAEVGYGNIAKQGDTSQLKPLPASDQGYAHDFADYMNATAANGHTNADNLGLQKLPITNPYDAPPGSIVVVRAGTPGTRNPVAGDIVVAGGGGKFYNDGNMGYGGSKNFPAGNTYVLGIYAPK